MRYIEWFGGSDAWQRPVPRLSRRDVVTAGVFLVLLVGFYELSRSYSAAPSSVPLPLEYLAITLLAVLMLFRRRYPLTTGILAFVHMVVVSIWFIDLNYQMSYMVVIFFAFYSMVAWARQRCRVGWVMLVMTIGLEVQVLWELFLRGDWDKVTNTLVDSNFGLIPSNYAWMLDLLSTNLLYMIGATLIGQSSWNQARDQAMLEQQAQTIEHQGIELREQAVLEERVRIARELHDVVAHHVSVMGVQAAAARRTLEKRPDMAAVALQNIEDTSRESVGQMRALLGTLRSSSEAPDQAASRAPQPSLSELRRMLDSFEDETFHIHYERIENHPDAASAVSLPLQLTLYRCIQEALSNVRRHSTAKQATVTVRIEDRPDGHVEIEVLDDGRPVQATTSGSGLGLVGMRERVASHNGTYEIGPRSGQGFRVRVRLPLRCTSNV